MDTYIYYSKFAKGISDKHYAKPPLRIDFIDNILLYM